MLHSFGNERKAKAIVDVVTKYAGDMLALNQANKSNEKKYVQPAVRNTLWPVLREQLSCGEQLDLENERAFKLHVENERDEADVVGLTDHCLKIVDADARLGTWEDKAILKSWDLRDVAQCQAEMTVECNELEDSFSVVPDEYCGVLQNGCNWTFLFRTVTRGKFIWSYVRTPATLENGAVSPQACVVVAQFLEHMLVIVDRLYDEIVMPKMIVRSMKLSRIPEGKEDDAEGKDDHEPTDSAGRSARALPSSKSREGTRSSSRSTVGKTNKGSVPKSNESTFVDSGKENLFLPLTTRNVMKQPTQSVRVFF